MAKQVMDFRCEHGVVWREWHSINDPFDCPECGKRLYTPKSAQHKMHLTAFGARLAWLFFGAVLLLAMVLVIIGVR